MSLKIKLVGFFVLLALLPLAAATLGFSVVLQRSETRRVDVRLEAELRAALAAYQDELGRAVRRVDRLAHSRAIQTALERRDAKALRAGIAGIPNVRIVGRGFAIGARHPRAAHRQALVSGRNGELLGRIVATVPLDGAFVRQLRTRSGIERSDRLAVLRHGRISGRPGQRLIVMPGLAQTVEVGDTRYRALETSPLTEPASVSLAVLAPQAEIDSATTAGERRLVLGLLASLLLIGLVASFVGRSIVRSLARLVGAANDIARGQVGVRVPVKGRDEFARLGRAFNSMASQLEYRLEELETERTRLREVASHFGEVLAATHDSDQLRRAVVETVVEATGASGGLIVGHRGDVVGTGRTDEGGEKLELPLRAGSQDFGRLVLSGQGFTPEQRETAELLAKHAVIALENARLHRIVERQALFDGLTGLANRRHGDEQLATEFHRAHRFSTPLAVVLTDLDDFKRINDQFGHPVGDTVLCEFARTLEENVRDIDLAGRWGGEEFVLILPGTDAEGAANLAARVREAVVRRPILAPDGTRIHLTASFGVAAYPDLGSPDELVAAADRALYEAKRAGKDRVVSAPPAVRRRRPA